MDVLALDLSKAMTGWARWSDDAPRPTYGSKQLGSEFTSRGDVYIALHKLFLEFKLFGAPDFVVIEAPRNPAHLHYPTNFMKDRQLIGLVEMTYYLATMIGVKSGAIREVETSDWWPYFNGHGFPKREKGHSTKDYTIATCRKYGFKTKNSDEADAVGILTYEIDRRGVTPPWLAHERLNFAVRQ